MPFPLPSRFPATNTIASAGCPGACSTVRRCGQARFLSSELDFAAVVLYADTLTTINKRAQGTLTMAREIKHSKAEIAAKLAQADDLASKGKWQSEIARMLSVSAMTLHRWRKMSSHSP